MSSVPPPLRESHEQTVVNNDQQEVWPNWREETTRLDYDGREIRIVFGRTEGSLRHEPEPAVFADFDPKPHDPDPDVWPLDVYDPGSAPVEDLVKTTGTFPAPHVAWVTQEYLEWKYGHDPRSVEVEAREIPRRKRPDGLSPTDKVTLRGPSSSLTLTDEHLLCLDRLARLWNGREVRGKHLLFDKCPDWETLFGDLDQDALSELFLDPSGNTTIAEAFPDHDWVETDSIFLDCQRILRKKVWYAPTLRARTLINNHDDLPSLRGDPKEGLRHRFTVGLVALNEQLTASTNDAIDDFDVSTYQSHSDHIVDICSKRDDNVRFIEVITGHNNWELHRQTYKKLSQLRSEGGTPIVIFDSRDTAYKVMNHWHRSGCGELPLGPFESNARISWGQQKIREAYADSDVDWDIQDWSTTTSLWRSTLGRDGFEIKQKNLPYIW